MIKPLDDLYKMSCSGGWHETQLVEHLDPTVVSNTSFSTGENFVPILVSLHDVNHKFLNQPKWNHYKIT